ncbi:Auxin efflux carrier [Macleaya cordata]|uniref:Auxin efflux carrier n=1 Tax=Macleaya cordata TaxID=56857 RepID=A0A200PR79_MACCD|nr:Auxin efflux carrier [Macleaya cordata]
MALLDLFVAASVPILEVLLVTGLGSFLALDSINILGEDARKHINNVVFYIFNPALIAGNLAKTITFDSMVKLWFMPVNILITFIAGSALGWVLIQITRAPSHLRGLILGCCAAGNLGNLLLIIIPAVCKEKGSPFGAPDVCNTYGMAYASLSMAIGAIYLWSYVYNIVRISSSKSKEVKENVYVSSLKFSEETSKLFPRSCTEELLPSEDCMIPEDQAELPYSRSPEKKEVPFSVKCKQHLEMLARNINFKRLFAPSTIGAIVGFVVGIVPQIRWLLIGESAPLRVIQDSASLLSDGAVPALTLIVGGNLTKGLKGSGIQKSIVIGIVVVKYILMPLLGVVVIKVAFKLGLIHSDPLYQFVLLLQFAMPPAMNMGTITQLFGSGESECSVIMLWTYSLASVSLTIWTTFFMWLVSS